MDDAELEERLIRARPLTPRREDPLGAREEALLESIIAERRNSEDELARDTPRPASRPLRRMHFGIAASVVALLMVAIGLIASPWPHRTAPAQALTPELLSVKPLPGDAGGQLMSLSEALKNSGDEAPSDVARFENWALEFSPDNPPKAIQPQRTELKQLADGSYLLEIVAGAPVGRDGNPLEIHTPHPAGTVLLSHHFEPGESPFEFAIPTEDTDWSSLLRDGEALSADAHTAEYFRATAHLRSEQALSRKEQSSLLTFLASLPGIRLDGETTDRLGRTGVSFSVEQGNQRFVLVVNGDLGLLAYEQIYIGSDRDDLEAPAVINYLAWY